MVRALLLAILLATPASAGRFDIAIAVAIAGTADQTVVTDRVQLAPVTDKPILYFMTSPNCPPCERVKRDIKNNTDGIADFFQANFAVKEQNTSVPTFRVEGRERIVGYKSARDLMNKLQTQQQEERR